MFLSNLKKSTFKAAIDSVSSGFVRGWVFNPDNSSGEQSFFVSINGEIVGKCITDKYRKDLEDAGFGNGFHGFTFSIQEHIKNITNPTITLLDTLQKKIEGVDYLINTDNNGNSAVLVKYEKYRLFYSIKSKTKPPFVVNLYDDGLLLFRDEITSEITDELMIITLPPESFNGAEHLFALCIADCPLPISIDKVFIPLLSVPDRTLVQSELILSHRYQTILSQLNKQDELNNSKNILIAANCLGESSISSKEKHIITLPNIDNPRISILVLDERPAGEIFHFAASLILTNNMNQFDLLVGCNPKSKEWAKIENGIKNIKLVAVNNTSNIDNLKLLIKKSVGELVLISNQLDECTSNYLDKLSQVFENEKIVASGGKLIDINGKIIDAGTGKQSVKALNKKPVYFLDPSLSVEKEVEEFCFSALMIRRKLLASLIDGIMHNNSKTEIIRSICIAAREESSIIKYVPSALGYSLFQNNLMKFNDKNISKDASNLIVSNENNSKSILVLDLTTPTPDQDAGSYASIQEMKILQALGFKVVFAADDLLNKQQYTEDLQRLGVEVLYFPYYKTMQDVLEVNLPIMDAVYITRYYIAEKYINYIKNEFPKLPIIFNNADLHFLREIRMGLNTHCVATLQNAVMTRNKELAVMGKADAVLSYSRIEHAVISSHLLKSSHIFLTPWVLETKPKIKSFKERHGIAFLGGYKHAPNIEAAEYFIKNVLPQLAKKSPHIKLYLYGSNMPDSFKKLEADNLEIVGYADSLDELYNNHKVFVVPLLSGAGIKGKVLESMAYGLPSVLSTIAAEETGLVHNVNSFIAESTDKWVESIEILYDNEATWNKFSNSSRDLAVEKYSFEKGCGAMKNVFDFLNVETSNNKVKTD